MTNLKIREALNKIDHFTLDSGDTFYDFVTAFDSFKHKMTNEDYSKLEEAINKNCLEDIDSIFTELQINESISDDDCVDEIVEKFGEVEEEYSLDKIYEEEEIEEGRGDLKIEPTKAIESGKIHYRLRDKKTGELASYKTPYWYPTREGAQEAIKDKSRDLGYGPSKKEDESLKLSMNFSKIVEHVDESVGLDEMAIQNPDLSHVTTIGTYAQFVIKLYELSGGDVTKSVPMERLCDAAGEPRENGKHTPSRGGQHRDLARRAGYAVKDGHWGLKPTPLLSYTIQNNPYLEKEYNDKLGKDYPERPFKGKSNAKGKTGKKEAEPGFELDDLDLDGEQQSIETEPKSTEPVKKSEPIAKKGSSSDIDFDIDDDEDLFEDFDVDCSDMNVLEPFDVNSECPINSAEYINRLSDDEKHQLVNDYREYFGAPNDEALLNGYYLGDNMCAEFAVKVPKYSVEQTIATLNEFIEKMSNEGKF